MILFDGNGLDLSGHSFDFSQFILDGGFYLDGMFNFVRTVQSFSNIAYQALFILAGVLMVSRITLAIFHNKIQIHKGISRRKLNRQIDTADMIQNRSSIIEHDLMKRALNRSVDLADIDRNRDSITEHDLKKRKLNREISGLDITRNREQIILDKIRDKEINLEAERRFRQKNWSVLVDDGVDRRKLSQDVYKRLKDERDAYHRKNHAYYLQRKREGTL